MTQLTFALGDRLRLVQEMAHLREVGTRLNTELRERLRWRLGRRGAFDTLGGDG